MSYTVYNPCTEEVIDPSSDQCFDDFEPGRVRGVGFVHKNYVALVQAAPTVSAGWTTGVTDKSIYIVEGVSGTFDGGSPVEGPGYGNQTSRLNGFNFSAAFKDPRFKANTAFYNSIKNSGNWHFAWRTGTQTRVSGNPVSIIPKSPTTDDVNSDVVWDVEVKWAERDQPVPFDTPAGIFV